MRKIALISIFIFLSSPIPFLFAKNYDLSQLNELRGKLSSGGGGGKKIDNSVLEPPKSRFIDEPGASKKLTKEDENYIKLHMKLANRYFGKKNYEKAKEEAGNVLERDNSHAGSHFMLAVIAGRLKDYKSAWYHIKIAKEKNSGESKIDDFIKKLKTVSSETNNPEWVEGIYTGLEKDASNRTFDLIEKLLYDNCSSNITSISTTDYKDESKTTVEITFSARDSFNANQIVSVLQKNNKSGITTINKSDNNLVVKLSYVQVKAENPDAKAIKGISEFVSDLTEQLPEVAINDTEDEETKNGTQVVVYDLSSREFPAINAFMRKISPYSLKYVLKNMELAYIGKTKETMWKAQIRVTYKI